MLTPSHFNTRTNLADAKVYCGTLQHKDCARGRTVEIEAEDFSQLMLELKVWCPHCNKYGGPANWDSVPLTVVPNRPRTVRTY